MSKRLSLLSAYAAILLLALSACGEVVATCNDDHCGEHAECVEREDGVECVCSEGYAGDTCDSCAPGYAEVEGVCEPDDGGGSVRATWDETAWDEAAWQ